MTLRTSTSMAAALTMLALSACTGSVAEPQTEEIPTVINHIETKADLTAYLLFEGHAVMEGQPTEGLFETPGSTLIIDGQEVQVVEFPTEQEAQQQASTISPDGSTLAGSIVDWQEPPHFYQYGKMILLYSGNDEGTLNTLEDAMGAQVAGAPDDEDSEF